jgi:hypothetical protein
LKQYKKLFKITEFNISTFKEHNSKQKVEILENIFNLDSVLTNQEFLKWMMSTNGNQGLLDPATTTMDSSKDSRPTFDTHEISLHEISNDLSPIQSSEQLNKVIYPSSGLHLSKQSKPK